MSSSRSTSMLILTCAYELITGGEGTVLQLIGHMIYCPSFGNICLTIHPHSPMKFFNLQYILSPKIKRNCSGEKGVGWGKCNRDEKNRVGKCNLPTPLPPALYLKVEIKLLYVYAAQCLLIASRFRGVNNELYVIQMLNLRQQHQNQRTSLI